MELQHLGLKESLVERETSKVHFCQAFVVKWVTLGKCFEEAFSINFLLLSFYEMIMLLFEVSTSVLTLDFFSFSVPDD